MKSKSRLRFYTNLFLTSALAIGGSFVIAKSALAEGTPAGTTITNTATGSFEGETSVGTVTVTSNAVTLSVLEVTGITVDTAGVNKATPAQVSADNLTPGPYQSTATEIVRGDIVYFDFRITNTGNSPTAIFIPDVTTISGTGGGIQRSVRVIAVDPDGLVATNAPTVLTTLVPNGGGITTAFLGTTDGYIPVNGTVTVRVAVEITGTQVGETTTVVLGNTAVANGQNEDYIPSPAPANRDVYTSDLALPAPIPTTGYAVGLPTANTGYAGTGRGIDQTVETDGNPVNGDTAFFRKEASNTQTATITQGIDYGDAPNSFFTVLNSATGYSNSGASHLISKVLGTDLFMGAGLPDAEANGVAAAAAADAIGDDSTTAPSIDDENGVTLPTLLSSSTNYTATVNVTNNTGSPAYLVGWIDFNKNNVFDAGEAQVFDQTSGTSTSIPTTNAITTITPIPTGTTALPKTLTWTGISGLASNDVLYARFRLTTDLSVIGNTTVTSIVAQPNRPLGIGEVEDYRITVGSVVQTPLTCDGRFYQIRATANNSNLYLINRFTNPYQDFLQSGTPTGTILNGLAYNPIDNYMYALFRGATSGSATGVTATNALYRLDNSTIVALGGITGLPNGFAPTAADFGPDGSYYVTRANGTAQSGIIELYKINISTRTATLIPLSQATGNIGDFAYNPVDGQLYGVGGGGNVTLFKINPATGAVTTATITGTSITPETWGTAFFDPIGTFYAYSNGGRFYRINKDLGVATLLSTAPTANVSDGAVCQFTSEKIDVVKAAGSVTRINPTTFDIPYTIQVKNPSTFNAPNVQITENFNLDPTFTAGSPTISIQVAPTVTSGTLTVNPSFTGLTTTTYNLLSGLNSLAAGASGTITFTVRLVYANEGNVPTTVLNNQVYASTITSTTAPGTPNPGFTFPSNIPVPPPDLLTADTSTNGNTLPLTANADTPSPTPVTLPTASNPNLLLVKRLTAINDVPIATAVNDGVASSNDDNANWFTTASTIPITATGYLQGEISRSGVKPGDRLEYTIYFLSAGDTPITNVTICDLIPPNTTFVNNAYDVVSGSSNRGIVFANSTITPTSYLTGLFDGDRAKFYPANILPPSACKKPTTDVDLNVADNTDGLVVVDVARRILAPDPAAIVELIPFATGVGAPLNSYGFVRFQVQVK
jgi:uncharacterized repeat protein (TIGR01451 family)